MTGKGILHLFDKAEAISLAAALIARLLLLAQKNHL
jgi:hypothetical protein